MPYFKDQASNFTGGQVSKEFAARSDTAMYERIWLKLKNCILRSSSWITQRPGTDFVDEFNEKNCRIIKYIGDLGDYFLTVSTTEVRLYQILSNNSVLLKQTTGLAVYTAAQVKELKYAVRGDVVLLFHSRVQTRKIVIDVIANSFTIALWSFSTREPGINGATRIPNEPMVGMTFEATDVKLKIDHNAANNDITANGSVFDANWVGRFIALEDKVVKLTAYNSATWMNSEKLEDHQHFWQLIGPVAMNGLEEKYFRVNEGMVSVSNGAGSGATTAFDGMKGDVTEVVSQGIVVRQANKKLPPTTNDKIKGVESEKEAILSAVYTEVTDLHYQDYWTENVFNDENGWPSTGVFHDGRLYISGTHNDNKTHKASTWIFGSVTGDYDNFYVGEGLATDAIAYRITDNEATEIRHIFSSDSLMAFTDTGVFYAPTTEDVPLAPDNFRMVFQTSDASDSNIEPVNLQDSIYFVDENKMSVIELVYSIQSRKYISTNLSLIYGDTIGQINKLAAWETNSRTHDSYLIATDDNGKAHCLVANNAEEIKCWFEWEFEVDLPLKVDIIDIENIGKETYLCFNLYVDGVVDNVFIARFTFDCPLDFASSVSAVVAGTPDKWKPVASKNLQIFGEIVYGGGTQTTDYNKIDLVTAFKNYVIPSVHQRRIEIYHGEKSFERTAADGAYIPLTSGANLGTYRTFVGKRVNCEIKPMPPNKEFTDGNVSLDIKGVNSMMVRLEDSHQIAIDGYVNTSEHISDTGDGNGLVIPTSYSSISEQYEDFVLGWSYDEEHTVSCVVPLPFKITSIIRRVEI